MRIPACGAVAVVLLSSFGVGHAGETKMGHVVAIGGNLRPENAAVFRRLVDGAGGRERARFAILPTAGTETEGPQRFAEDLVRYGVDPRRIEIVDLSLENAAVQSSSPAVVEQIKKSTGVFFTGGDQVRIMRALLKPDGTESPALQAIRQVWASGGVIAGSSAGAAVQSDPMIAASGLADEALDEGMDTLDFGLMKNSCCRGLLVTRGLGFFRAGLVDQHFSQYRGRLARLARACIEQHIRYGFGIDEDTAMAVGPDGVIEVVGPGNLTIVDARDAACQDGPLGCRMMGVRVSVLEQGDRFDPQTGKAVIHSAKTPIAAGTESFHGNHLMPDIAGHGAAMYALKLGLADNTSRKQVGVTLKYNQHYGHGYRLTFTEDDGTRCYAGYVESWYGYALLGVRLDVEPIVSTLQPPQMAMPVDVPQDASRQAIEALVFRGMLLADDQRRFRPQEPITRAELAAAMAQTLRLLPARESPAIKDVPPSLPWAEEINLIVSAGLMPLDDQGAFHPTAQVPRQEAATMLIRLTESYRGERLTADPVPLEDVATVSPGNKPAVFAAVRAGVLTASDNYFEPAASLTRQQAAVAIYRVVGFPW